MLLRLNVFWCIFVDHMDILDKPYYLKNYLDHVGILDTSNDLDNYIIRQHDLSRINHVL